MPAKYVKKEYAANQYYHVFSRGVAKQKIFWESADYQYFIRLLERYLGDLPAINSSGAPYPRYKDGIELATYCLMPNHFHFLVFQHQEKALADFMRSLLGSYSMYFNLKYRRVGPLFQSRYKAKLVAHDSYLTHITRYIHLNPRHWQNYKYSSLQIYLGGGLSSWLHPHRILSMFGGSEEYRTFLENYRDHRQMLKIIQHELADH